VLGGLAQAANDADQPLRAERDGPAGAILSHQKHDGVPVQDGASSDIDTSKKGTITH